MCYIRDVVFVHRGKWTFDRLSHDIESLSIIDRNVSTGILLVFFSRQGRMITRHYM